MNTIDKLRQEGFSFKKSLGQNFITDINLLNAIVSDSNITDTDTVIEIGAGAGTLTAAIARKAKHVLAFEIDNTLTNHLNDLCSELGNATLFTDDILKLSRPQFLDKISGYLGGDTQFKVVANLPYYITTPLIFYFLESDFNVKSLTIMVQKEVALRMAAKAGTPDYGALSLAVACRANAKITRIVNKNMFIPTPKVDSAIVSLEIINPFNYELSKLIKCLFAMRRKTALNNLTSGFGLSRAEAENALSAIGVNINIRGEQLNLFDIINLNDAIKAIK